MTTRDPHVEPENSTVDNWLGQEVNEDVELVEQLLEETDGDQKAAERAFDEQSAGARPDPGEVKRKDGEGYA